MGNCECTMGSTCCRGGDDTPMGLHVPPKPVRQRHAEQERRRHWSRRTLVESTVTPKESSGAESGFDRFHDGSSSNTIGTSGVSWRQTTSQPKSARFTDIKAMFVQKAERATTTSEDEHRERPQCAICQEAIPTQECRLPCGHEYHRRCIQRLIDHAHEEVGHNRLLPCPVCRHCFETSEWDAFASARAVLADPVERRRAAVSTLRQHQHVPFTSMHHNEARFEIGEVVEVAVLDDCTDGEIANVEYTEWVPCRVTELLPTGHYHIECIGEDWNSRIEKPEGVASRHLRRQAPSLRKRAGVGNLLALS